MGLEQQGSSGSSSESSLKAAPGLAQIMQDEGSASENANVLNLFLDNSSLPGGAPSPLTNFVGTTSISVSNIVLNSNFTREKYGEAAVNNNISLESDRRSLLLNNSQTQNGIAKSIISSIKLDNGVSAVQSMSDSDVTSISITDEDIISDFANKSEDIYVNAVDISWNKRNNLLSGFVSGTSKSDIIDFMINDGGGDPSGFNDFSTVATDQTAMSAIANSLPSSILSMTHPVMFPEIIQSLVALDEIVITGQGHEAIEEAMNTNEALNKVKSAWTRQFFDLSDDGTTISPEYLIATVRGAGGGGGGIDNFGGDGTESSLGPLTAEGGEGGKNDSVSNPYGAGGGTSNSLSDDEVVINAEIGGADNGGNTGYTDGGTGGGGGLITAFIINNGNNVTANIGQGGSGTQYSSPGGDGSIEVWTL